MGQFGDQGVRRVQSAKSMGNAVRDIAEVSDKPAREAWMRGQARNLGTYVGFGTAPRMDRHSLHEHDAGAVGGVVENVSPVVISYE